MTAEEETLEEEEFEIVEPEPESEMLEEPEKKYSERDLMRLFSILDGNNPDAQQTITDFMDMSNPVEKTNLPIRKDVQRIAYCHYAGQIYFPNKPDNAFNKAVVSISLAFSAKGGEKSKQFVDIVRQNQDLSALQGVIGDEKKRSILDKLTGRGKTE